MAGAGEAEHWQGGGTGVLGRDGLQVARAWHLRASGGAGVRGGLMDLHKESAVSQMTIHCK